MDKAKPFDIPKREVWEAFKRVKANQGAAGVDGQSIADFEADLSNNLYKLWNRLSSGSYFPPPVRRVDIPKADGGTRPLGIPTVADRSCPGGRPSVPGAAFWSRCSMPTPMATGPADLRSMPCAKLVSAAGATTGCSISTSKAYFDSIDWELLLKAVRHHTDCPWVLLYIERWLKAPVQMEDGSVVPRTAGTPQGGVISPLLANLFLHYAFDTWMARKLSAHSVRAIRGRCHLSLQERRRGAGVMERACRIALRPASWCCIRRRRRSSTARMRTGAATFPNQSFDFLGFQFRARKTIGKGRVVFAHCFLPAASPKALTAISRTIRRWALHHRSDKSLQDLAEMYNPCIRGWINYYSHFYRTQLRPTLKRIDALCHPLGAPQVQAVASARPKGRETGLTGFAAQIQQLFAHWQLCHGNGRTSGAV